MDLKVCVCHVRVLCPILEGKNLKIFIGFFYFELVKDQGHLYLMFLGCVWCVSVAAISVKSLSVIVTEIIPHSPVQGSNPRPYSTATLDWESGSWPKSLV